MNWKVFIERLLFKSLYLIFEDGISSLTYRTFAIIGSRLYSNIMFLGSMLSHKNNTKNKIYLEILEGRPLISRAPYDSAGTVV